MADDPHQPDDAAADGQTDKRRDETSPVLGRPGGDQTAAIPIVPNSASAATIWVNGSRTIRAVKMPRRAAQPVPCPPDVAARGQSTTSK